MTSSETNRLTYARRSVHASSRARCALVTICLCLQAGGAFAASGSLDADIGAESAKAVEAQMGIYDDAELTEYVTDVGTRLVGVLADERFTFQFFVVDDPSPNAFALPGGFVYVTRGLLPLLQTEDELAGVHMLRRALATREGPDTMRLLIERIGKFPTNADFLKSLKNAV